MEACQVGIGNAATNNFVATTDKVALWQRPQCTPFIRRVQRIRERGDTVHLRPGSMIQIPCHRDEPNHVAASRRHQRRHGSAARVADQHQSGGTDALLQCVDRLTAGLDYLQGEPPLGPECLPAILCVGCFDYWQGRARYIAVPCGGVTPTPVRPGCAVSGRSTPGNGSARPGRPFDIDGQGVGRDGVLRHIGGQDECLGRYAQLLPVRPGGQSVGMLPAGLWRETGAAGQCEQQDYDRQAQAQPRPKPDRPAHPARGRDVSHRIASAPLMSCRSAGAPGSHWRCVSSVCACEIETGIAPFESAIVEHATRLRLLVRDNLLVLHVEEHTAGSTLRQ